MEKMGIAKHYGTDSKMFRVNGLTLVHSDYHRVTACPWHYHQNAHFAFTTGGALKETHRAFQLQLQAGSLLYNHSDEPHCNSEYSEHVSALHVDMDRTWFEKHDLPPWGGLHELNDPVMKNHFHKILKELHIKDSATALSIEGIMLATFQHMRQQKVRKDKTWTTKVKNLLYDRYNEQILLREVADEAGLHPTYLCQQFPAVFQCSFGEYLRKIRIEKAVDQMLTYPRRPLTEIALNTGFSDQSHFSRTFKRSVGVTPTTFLKGVRP
jgi:AraC family transcriptional regulator